MSDDLVIVEDFSKKESMNDVGSGRRIPDGKYHVVVYDLEKDAKEGKTPCLVLTLRILAGTVSDQRGQNQFERVFLTSDKPAIVERRHKIAKALGLIKQSMIGDTSAKVNWADARGKHLIVEIKEESYQTANGDTRKSAKVTFDGVWAIADPKVAEVPKDTDALGADGIQAPSGGDPKPDFDNV